MAETSLREGVREVAQQARPSEINPKLEEAMQNQPLLPHLLSFRAIVLIAAGVGAVVALVLFLLISPMMAGVGLLLVFFATWFGLAVRDYAPRRRQREAASAASRRRRGRRRTAS